MSTMAPERKIPWTQQLGEIGESTIKSYLAYFSNPMKPAFDIGIDFFCEMSEDGAPSGVFFLVQAKGTQHFDEKWGRSFDKDTIVSWLSQQFPAYVIVYDEVNKNCYWISIEEHRKSLIERTKSDNKTVYLAIDRTRVLKPGENDEFIKRIKEDSASVSFRLNLVQGAPLFIGEGYVKGIPIMYLSDVVVVNIRERVRMSLNYLIHNYLLRNDLTNAYHSCRFLTDFDKSHYDHFVLFGNICKALGKAEEACVSYEKAIEICQRDKNWNRLKNLEDPSIEDIIASIRIEMKKLGCKSSADL
jgi:hypothetical protein